MTSCHCSMKMTVYGNPGTEIYKPSGEKLATISNTGNAQVKLECMRYYGYLISKNPYTGQALPFLLDYKKHNRHDMTWAIITAVPTAYIGEVVFLLRSNQLAHDSKFKYLAEQKTIEDMPMVELIHPQPPKTLEQQIKRTTAKDELSTMTAEELCEKAEQYASSDDKNEVKLCWSYYRASAEKGYAKAQTALGVLLMAAGEHDEGMEWIGKAVVQGYEPAKDFLIGLVKESLE